VTFRKWVESGSVGIDCLIHHGKSAVRTPHRMRTFSRMPIRFF
jgi:hypothetical protein